MRKHDFRTSLSFGKRIEKKLDDVFAVWFYIEPVTLEVERKQGVDRLYTRRDTGKTLKIEYKADRWGVRTGNVFIELEVDGKPGWAVKTQADIVLYALVDASDAIQQIIVLTKTYIQKMLPVWWNLEQIEINNGSFSGRGCLYQIDKITERKLRI